jgi:hypothetical protein
MNLYADARPLRSNFVDNLRGFQSQNKLKKADKKALASKIQVPWGKSSYPLVIQDSISMQKSPFSILNR